MFLQVASGTAKPSPLQGARGLGPLFSSSGTISSRSLIFSSSPSADSVLRLVFPRKPNRGCAISASTEALTGVVFQPFEEVKSDEFLVPITPSVSLARQKYAGECEAAINEQIKYVPAIIISSFGLLDLFIFRIAYRVLYLYIYIYKIL